MMNKSPSSLEEWLKFLQNKKFPVAASHLKQISRLLTAPDEALDKMQKHIAGEPFIGFMAISVANKMVTNNRGDITTPIHAASMIGMNGLLKITQKLYPCNFSKDNLAHQEFLRQLQISYESASIAKYWSIERRNSHNEEVFWTTFYRDAVRWLLWFYSYNQMMALSEKLKQGISAKEAEEDVFGCRIDQLAVKMFQHWSIPSATINTFMTEHIPSTRELRALASLTENTESLPHYSENKRLIFLANNDLLFSTCASKIAQIANQTSWYNKTLDIYYRAISTALHCKHSTTIKTVHSATVEAAQLFSDHSKTPLACQLLVPYLYGKGKIPVRAKKEMVKVNPLSLFQKQLFNKGSNSKDCLVNTIKIIRSLIPSGHQALILNYQNKVEQMKASLQYGFDTNLLKQVKWDSKTGVMRKLMSKRSAILLDKPKLEQVSKQLPSPFLAQLKRNKQLILASFQHKNGDWTILWVATDKLFSEEDFNNLKRILALISKRLA